MVEIVMRPISIAKIAGSGSVCVAACSVALFFGVANMQHEERLDSGTVTPTTSPLPPAPLVKSEDSTTVAAAVTEAASIAAELAGPPSSVAADQSVPSFDVARTEIGDAVIAGRAPPGAIVDLVREGERLDRAVADASGQFVMVPSRLPAGSYELTLIARLPDGTVASSKQGVMVTVNDAGANSGATQSRAEYVPETASQAAAPPQPPLRAAKRQENAAFRSAHAMAVGSTSDKGLSTPATGHKILTRVVSRGDSLWRISRITYGDGTRYAIVYRANRDRIRDPNLIRPGQVLLVPKRH